jgi:hypothetical protein
MSELKEELRKLTYTVRRKCSHTLAEKQEISRLSRSGDTLKKNLRLEEINSKRQIRFDKIGGDKDEDAFKYYLHIIAFNFNKYVD